MPLVPNEISDKEFCCGPRSLHLANILAFAPKLSCPINYSDLIFSNDFMYLITTPSQKYDTPDLTYIRAEVAKKATLKK